MDFDQASDSPVSSTASARKLDREGCGLRAGCPISSHADESSQGYLESVLAQLWSELLCRTPIETCSDFFKMGGHPLLAVQLISRVRDRIGVQVAIADLVAHPTFAAFAREVSRVRSQSGSAVQAVPLRQTGSQRPLFITYTAAGDLAFGSTLARRIECDFPIYGLPGASWPETHPVTIEGAGSRIIGMIKTVQAHGPYRIAGLSFGGLLAYEVATQLIGMNEEVDFLGLIDSEYIDHELVAPTGRSGLVGWLLAYMVDGFNLKVPPEELLAAIPPGSDLLQQLSLLQPRLQSSLWQKSDLPFSLDAQDLEAVVQSYRTNVCALAAYVPQPLDLRLNIFVSENFFRQPRRDRLPLLGWEKLVPKAQIIPTRISGLYRSSGSDDHLVRVTAALATALRTVNSPAPFRKPHDEPLSVLAYGRQERTAIVVAPGAGASVTSFLDFVQECETDRSVYGLSYSGLDPSQVPHTTVEAASLFYTEAIIRKLKPTNLHLLGHSFGGWIVFDLALRLQQLHFNIASLTLVDSPPPSNERTCPEFTQAQVLEEYIDAIEMAVDRPVSIKHLDLASVKFDEAVRRIHKCLVSERIMTPRSTPNAIFGSIVTFARQLRTAYVPGRSFEGPTTLLLPSVEKCNGAHTVPVARVECWKTWAPQLQVRHSKGNHVSMLKRPHVATLASLYKDTL